MWASVALVAWCALCAVTASGALSRSKLSLHVNGVDANVSAFLAATQPRVVKLLDPSSGDVAAVKQASPRTVIIGRVYMPAQPVGGDPTAAAAAWLAAVAPSLAACPGVDYWEGYNEPGVGDAGSMAWYAAFEVARVALLAAATPPARAAIGQFSAGTPDVTTPAVVNAFMPAVDAARANGGVLALHEYSSPTMQGCFDNATAEGWLTGRYRKLYREFLIPQNRSLPLVISETGIDNSPCGSPNLGGWLSYCSWWASHGLPGDCSAQYVAQLGWYDALLRADDYVLGATVFCKGCDGFDTYEVATVLPDLTAYMQQQAAPAASTARSPPSGMHYSMAHNNTKSLPYSHNANFAVTPAGRLAIVFQASTSGESAADQKIYIVFSADAGTTWSAPAVAAGNGSRAEWGPVLATDAAAGLLYLFYAESVDGTGYSLCGDIFMQASADDGATWAPRAVVAPVSAWGGVSKCTDNKVVRLAGGGGWALPFFSARTAAGQAGVVGAGLVASPAGGAGPWAPLAGNITLAPGVSVFLEPAVAQCGASSSSLLMLLRTQIGQLYASTSGDAGDSWAAAHATGVPNPNSKVDLATWVPPPGVGGGLAAGDVLLAYNPSNCSNCSTQPSCWCPRTPLAVSVSRDCGQTWGTALLVEPDDGTLTFSYPTIGQCGIDPGTGPRICVVYTYLAHGVDASGIRFASFPASLLSEGLNDG